jgi:hypothetical protein
MFFDLEISKFYIVQVFDCLFFPKGFAYFTGTKSAKIFYHCLRNNNNNGGEDDDDDDNNNNNNNNNRGDWNHLKLTQTLPGQHTRKARNQGTTKTAILSTLHIVQKVLM